MGDKVRDVQAGFAGGLNITSDPALMRPDQARQMVNYRLDSTGKLTKRGGTQSVSLPSFIGTGVGKYLFYIGQGLNGGAVYAIYGNSTCSFASLTYTNPNSTSWTQYTGTTAYPPVGLIAEFTAGAGNPCYYFASTNAGGLLHKAVPSGTTLAMVAATARCDGVTVYNNRLWGWYGNSLYYSAIDNGDTLGIAASSGGQIIVSTYGVRNIKECRQVGSSLLIWLDKGITRLTGFGQDDISVSPQGITRQIGLGNCGATHRLVSVVGNVAYFVSPQGLYTATEDSVEPVDRPDHPDPLRQYTAAQLAASQMSYNEKTSELQIFLSGVGVYNYHTILQAWSGPFTGQYVSSALSFAAWVPLTDASGNYVMTFCSAETSGAIYVTDTTTIKDGIAAAGTGGSAYTATAQCHRMYGGDMSYSKAWRWIIVNASTLDSAAPPTAVAYAVNGGSSTMTFNAPITAQFDYYLGPSGVGPYLDVTISDGGVSASTISAVTVEGFFLGQR